MDLRPKRLDYLGTGPPWPVDPARFRDELVAGWKRSTAQMALLCRANGIRYTAFIQPNQYLSGTKPMGDAERKVAIFDAHPYAPAIVQGYPLLLKAAEELRQQGIEVHELTRAFEKTPEAVYIDNTGHISVHGNRILADVMADRVRPVLLGEASTPQ